MPTISLSRAAQRRRLVVRGLLLAVLLVTVVASVALAQSDLGGKVRAGEDVRVGRGETIAGDLYVAGRSITVDADVPGDVVAAAGTVNINGNVGGDVLAAGGVINLNGTVTGDARTAGGQINVNDEVGEDLLAAGGSVLLASGATVGEDLILSAGQASIDGTVEGDATGSAGTYSKTGTVRGTDHVVVGPQEGEAVIVERNPVLEAIQHFFAVLLIGGLALWLAPRVFRRAESAVREQPLLACGWGVVGFIGWIGALVVLSIFVALVAFLLALLGFGALVGLDLLAGIVAFLSLILAFVVVAFFLADAVVGLAIARLLSGDRPRLRREGAVVDARTRNRELLLFVAGVALVVLVASLPILGPWVKLVVAVLGLGAVLLALWRRGGTRRTDTEVVAPAA